MEGEDDVSGDAAAVRQPDKVREAVERALRRLPLQPEVEADGRLGRAADALALLVRTPANPVRPNAFRPITEKQRRRELDTLAEQAAGLAVLLEDIVGPAGAFGAALDNLHGASITALDAPPGNRMGADLLALASFARSLQAFTSSLGQLAQKARSPQMPVLRTNAGRGAPKKHWPEGITRVAAAEYWRLTGTKVTVQMAGKRDGVHDGTGPFLDLLEALFAVAGIKASPEAQAREYIRWASKRSGDLTPDPPPFIAVYTRSPGKQLRKGTCDG